MGEFSAMNRRTAPLVIVGAVLVVVFSIVSGVRMLRSPFGDRRLSDDDRRIAALVALSRAIEAYVVREGTLPGELDDLTPDLARRSMTRDPDSEDPYDYRVVGPQAFELCAEFDDADGSPAAGTEWAHDDDRECFIRETTATPRASPPPPPPAPEAPPPKPEPR
jgi:hypothetical protein